MAVTSINQIKNWFKNGLKPAQEHFWHWMDSYWHKEDEIPISSIGGLDEALGNKSDTDHGHDGYADINASNLTEENVAAWQSALNLSAEVNDDEVGLTEDHEYLGLTAENNQADFNETVATKFESQDEAIGNKMSKPENEGSSEDYQYVIGMDEEGDVAKLPANDLGKNIGNTDLEILEPRVLDTNGFPFSIAELPNKSTDATFTDFMGKNATGQVAKIGYPAFKLQAENWTSAQKQEFTQILNGGFSTGTMAVNLISPPIFELENNNIYLVLRGANLNLHPTNRKIEILNATTQAVLAEVPVSQIQTYASGTELVFFYNFYSLGVGTYKLRLTSGVSAYVTSLNFQIVSKITNIDLKTNVFDILTSYPNTLSYGTPDTVVFENEIQGSVTSTPIFSAKSSELFAMGEDWYLELLIDNSFAAISPTSNYHSRIGVGYSSTVNQLAYSQLNYLATNTSYSGGGIGKKLLGTSTVYVPNPLSGSVIFIKQGNLLTVISGTQTWSETISNNSGYSIFLQVPNRSQKETFSAQIIKAYTF
ncbi:MAG: hypothetical protein GX159_09820 [Flavobacteriaceae bacterium]|jgi:hypothetical protein|nr:hypothetical protein [Flavobacteriaceae bacterium]